MGKIVYTRGTSYYLTVNYTAPTYLGATVFFTAKTVANDADSTDTTNQLFAPKSAAIPGSSFPQTLVLKISPGDIPVTVNPANNYYYSVKVKDTNGDEYMVDEGTFVLNAYTTNET